MRERGMGEGERGGEEGERSHTSEVLRQILRVYIVIGAQD
jgi:hypothetical protein